MLLFASIRLTWRQGQSARSLEQAHRAQTKMAGHQGPSSQSVLLGMWLLVLLVGCNSLPTIVHSVTINKLRHFTQCLALDIARSGHFWRSEQVGGSESLLVAGSECSSTSQRKAETWIFVANRPVGGIVAMLRAQDQSVIKRIRLLCVVNGALLFEHSQTPSEYWCFAVHMHEQLKFKLFELLCTTVTARL